MLIVEGMDGTGKSTLVKKLHENTGLPVHTRAVADQTGDPVDDLFQWAFDDVTTWDAQPLSIYDRHPLVSEYIYGPTIRGRVAKGFRSRDAALLSAKMRKDAFVVFCVTDAKTIHENLKRIPQMDGVKDHTEQLYVEYTKFIAQYSGRFAVYDYTGESARWDYMTVLAKVQDYITERTAIQR